MYKNALSSGIAALRTMAAGRVFNFMLLLLSLRSKLVRVSKNSPLLATIVVAVMLLHRHVLDGMLLSAAA
jgi:hypothetical protein